MLYHYVRVGPQATMPYHYVSVGPQATMSSIMYEWGLLSLCMSGASATILYHCVSVGPQATILYQVGLQQPSYIIV